jgi:hypothetical protein
LRCCLLVFLGLPLRAPPALPAAAPAAGNENAAVCFPLLAMRAPPTLGAAAGNLKPLRLPLLPCWHSVQRHTGKEIMSAC